MRCSTPGCGSEEHFRRFCPIANAGKGKGKSLAPGKSSGSSSGYVASEPEFVPGMTPLYLATLTNLPAPNTSSIVFADGTREVLNLSDHVPPPTLVQQTFSFFAVALVFMMSAVNSSQWLFPNTFHALVRLASGVEGLLIDCGAISNLAGEKWIRRSAALADKSGQGTTWTDIPKCKVEGVGSGSSEITRKARVPICLSSGSQATYEASVVDGSELPALLGLQSLESRHAIIDTGHQRLVFPGPGGFELRLSPGSVSLALERANSGHLLLPSSEWSKLKGSTSQPLNL